MNNLSNEIYDVVVVGGGPAGLTAAIYLARARFSVLVLEKNHIGGQISITEELVNYPGIVKTSGKEITENMRIQATRFGASFLNAEVYSFDLKSSVKKIKTSRGEINSLGVVIATGASPRNVGFIGETNFRGRGVAYCATCDGEFFTGKELLVIGGGFSACEEALFLTKYATKVTILVRKSEFSCAQCVIDNVFQNPKIKVLFNSELKELRGESAPMSAIIYNNKTKETFEYRSENKDSFGVFVFVGYRPETDLIKGVIDLDENGYVIANEDCKTNLDGVFVAGDLRQKRLRQVVTAVADGAISATALEKYLPIIRSELGLKTIVCAPLKEEKTNDKKQTPASLSNTDVNISNTEIFFDEAMRVQIKNVFSRFEHKLSIYAEYDNRPVSTELKRFLNELVSLTDNIELKEGVPLGGIAAENLPAFSICNVEGKSKRVVFHGVPGGHEINSLILALYNAAGPGQALDEDVQNKIRGISNLQKIQVLVSLSCTLCPEVVIASQRIALKNENVYAEMFDLAHFPDLQKKYNVMSVPALIINDKLVSFGKKTLPQILDLMN